MPGKRIPDLTAIAGASTANDDNLVIFDTDANTTKRILRSQLAAGIVGDLPYTPSGGIAATTVPTAIAELDTEKVAFTRLDDNDGSNLVGFLQAGANAVPRTAQSKMRDVVSVLDFGADPTGATDSTQEIQDAITASAGKTLIFPAGTYDFSSTLTLSANTDYIFDNATLRVKSGTAVPSSLILPNSGTRIIGLKLNGNKDAVSGNCFGVRISAKTRVVMHNCRLDNVLGFGLGLYATNDCLISDLTINNPGDKTTNPTSYEFGDGIYLGDSANRNKFVNININHDFVSGQTQSGPVRCGIVITDGSANSFSNVNIENVNRPIQLETDDALDVIAYNEFSNITINQRSNSNSAEVVKLEKRTSHDVKIYGNKFTNINARGGLVNHGHGSVTATTLYLLAYGPNVYDNVFTNVYAEKSVAIGGSGYTFIGCDFGTLRGGDPAGLDALVNCTFDSCSFGPQANTSYETNIRLNFTGTLLFNNCTFYKTQTISGHRFQADNTASGTNALLLFTNCVFEGDLDSSQYLVQSYGRANWTACKFNGNRIAGTVQLISLAYVYARRLANCSYRQTNGVNYAISASDGDILDTGSIAETAMASSLTSLSGTAVYRTVDYEEGTWTPAYTNTTPPTTPYTMDIVAAKYFKIGKQVTVTAQIRTDNVDTTGASGTLRITGLPFTSSSTGGNVAVTIGFASDFAANTPIGGLIPPNSTRIDLNYRSSVTGASTSATQTSLTTGVSADKNNLMFSATYFTA